MPYDERQFQDWYAGVSKKMRLHPNPDEPKHFYDYRALYKSGVREPDISGHWPSEFKLKGHSREIVDGVNTRTGQIVDPSSRPRVDYPLKPRKTQEPSTLTRIHQTLEPYSIPGLYRRVKKFAGQAMDRLFETPPPKEGLRTLPELRGEEAQRKFPLEPSHIPSQEFPLVPSHKMNRPLPPLAAVVPTNQANLTGVGGRTAPEKLAPIVGRERGLLTQTREGEYPGISIPTVPTAGREGDLLALEAEGVRMPGEAQGVAGPTSPLPSLTEPTKKGFLENIDRATLMGLATTGLSMMAKGGQYTEKPQTLGGIAGEAGLAGLGTYLHVKEREDALKAKADALAATEAYRKAKLGQGDISLDLQRRRVETGEQVAARGESLRVPVYDPKTGLVTEQLVPRGTPTLRAPTESGTMAHLVATDRDAASAWVYNRLHRDPKTVRIDDAIKGNKHVARVFDVNTGKLLLEEPYTKVNEAIQAKRQEKTDADKEEKTILGAQAQAIQDLTKTFQAKKGITANIMSMVGLPPDQMRAAMANTGINQKDVDAFAADLDKVRGKFLKPLHEWNQRTKGVTGGRGEIYSTLYKEYQDRQSKFTPEKTSIFDQK